MTRTSIIMFLLLLSITCYHWCCWDSKMPWRSYNSLPGTTKEVVRFEHPATRNDDDIRQRSPTRFALFTTPTFTTLVPPVAYVYSWQWRFASPLAGMQLHFAPTTVAMYTSRLYCEQKSFSMACILGGRSDQSCQWSFSCCSLATLCPGVWAVCHALSSMLHLLLLSVLFRYVIILIDWWHKLVICGE